MKYRLTKLKRLVHLYTFPQKRVISTTSSALTNIGIEAASDTKPEGWDTAKPYHTIPGPKPLPIFGNTWRYLPLIGNLYGLDSNQINTLFYKKYGEIARLGSVSFPDMVMLYSPKDIEHLFRNEGKYPIREGLSKSFAYYKENIRPDIFQNALGVASVNGEAWYEARRKLNPMMLHPATVAQHIGGIDEIANDLIQKMRSIADSSPQREMPEDFNLYLLCWTLETIAFVCLDKRLGSLNINLQHDSEPIKIIKASAETLELFSKIENIPTFRDIHKNETWQRFVEQMDFLLSTLQKYINEAIQRIEMERGKDTEGISIAQQLLKEGEKSTVACLFDFITAGIDTTARVAASCMYYLAKTTRAQNALREEMYKLLPNKDSPVTNEVSSKAIYLKAVIKESMRLSPIGTSISRITVKDMVMGGYQIPKGTNVLSCNLVLCHSEENYTKAMEFIPERWLRTTTGNLSAKSISPFTAIPFGVGQRACIGKRVANLELEVSIAKVIRNFYLEWHHKDPTFKSNPFYGIIDPLKFRISEVEK